ncbi:MAG: type I restriction enzyme HsdR N-terminal domain-containing protein [Smithella sp.]|jgi:predicted type IV restriction endonuclease
MVIDITKDFKKYISDFRRSDNRGIKNEHETSGLVSKFCEDVLGYEFLREISLEYRVKHKYVDYAIVLDKKVQFFIEVKRTSLALKENHVEQASSYAANEGIHWVLLTNGKNWKMYHLSFGARKGIQHKLVWDVDILEDDKIKDSISKLSMLHKKNITKGMLDAYFNRQETLSPENILQAIFHEKILHLICLNLKKSSGIKIDKEELRKKVKDMISKETWKKMNGDNIKIISKKKSAKQKKNV